MRTKEGVLESHVYWLKHGYVSSISPRSISGIKSGSNEILRCHARLLDAVEIKKPCVITAIEATNPGVAKQRNSVEIACHFAGSRKVFLNSPHEFPESGRELLGLRSEA